MNEVDDYVGRVNKALRGLPKPRREEIVAEIGEHARAAVAELTEPSASDIRNALDRIGEPEEIAEEARERFGISQPVATWREYTAIVFLLLGWLLPVAGTVVGLVLLWSSRVWTRAQKQLGTVVVIIATVGIPAIAVTAGPSKTCEIVNQEPANCVTRGGGLGPIEIAVSAALLVAVVVVMVKLWRQLGRGELRMQ